MNIKLNTAAGATVRRIPTQSPFAKGDIGGFGIPKFSNFVKGQ